jgi:hypothetical protein
MQLPPQERAAVFLFFYAQLDVAQVTVVIQAIQPHLTQGFVAELLQQFWERFLRDRVAARG